VDVWIPRRGYPLLDADGNAVDGNVPIPGVDCNPVGAGIQARNEDMQLLDADWDSIGADTPPDQT
jgi:hypothetical protein